MASKKQIEQAWNKAKKFKTLNPNEYRKDIFGNKIRKQSYGTQGEMGWELDHSNPKSKGGTESPKNLKPLHWEENRRKGSTYPYKKK